MGRRRQLITNDRYQPPRNRRDGRNNRGRVRDGQARDNEGAEGCSTNDGSVPSTFVTITANGCDGKWVSLFKLDIMGIQFEAVLSTGSDDSVLSSRVYDLIENKLSGDDRYKLQTVPDIRVRDSFGREIKQLGAIRIPCTIFRDCDTKSHTQDIRFFVVEGGEIDGVVGSPAFSAVLLNFAFPSFGKPSRVPRIIGVQNQTKNPSVENSTRSSDKVISTIVGKKEFSNAKYKSFKVVNKDGTSQTHKALVCLCDDDELVVPGVLGASAITSEMKDLIINELDRRDQKNHKSMDEENPAECCSPPDTIVTILPMSSGKHPSMVKMKIANVQFEGLLSIRSGGTVLSSRIYDRIALESKDTHRYRLKKDSSGIQVCDITGNQLKLLGTLRIPCKFFSARGTNSVVEHITFLVVDGASVDCVLGEPEIFSCKISIILHRHLLVFNNNHPSPIPIAMVGAEEDPDLAFKEEERKNLPAERPLSPLRIITIGLMSLTGEFPFMVKMDIVGVPFELVVSTLSSGSVLSSEVYNRIVRKTEDPRYQLQKTTNVEVQDIVGNPMKLLGILDVPCRFICARGENSVIEIMQFPVVEDLVADGVFGSSEIGSLNLGIRFERRNSAICFSNYKPPIEIAILEKL